MGDSEVHVEYLSIGANRHSAVADWHSSGLVAFGADANVALWWPSASPPKGLTTLLTGHTAIVKAVKFVPSTDAEGLVCLVSGSDDKSLKVWALDAASGVNSCTQTIHEHSAPINCIASFESSPSARRNLVATGAADATVKLWAIGADCRLVLVQSIQLKPKYFPLDLALSQLGDDGQSCVLAVAGTRGSIQIYVANLSEDAIQFDLQATLTGHEGWIRSLDFTREHPSPGSDLLLASGSQDKYIRLWRFHQGSATAGHAADKHPESAVALGAALSNKAHRLRTGVGASFGVTFEALLLGHDDWVYSARWERALSSPPATPSSSSSDSPPPRLLSTSADNSLAVWRPDDATGIWLTAARLGEASREKGATTATGSTGGFWAGLWVGAGSAPFSADPRKEGSNAVGGVGASVICLARTGSWRRWEELAAATHGLKGDGDEDERRLEWRPCLGASGHTRAVTGIAWSRNGEYLLSTGQDQTTRLHAQWRTRTEVKSGTDAVGNGKDVAKDGGSSADMDGVEEAEATWHEMARPQIHGYDLNCIDALGAGAGMFVSGADEKMLRVFRMPRGVARLLRGTSGAGTYEDDDEEGQLPDAADMPVLGLSNKAVAAEPRVDGGEWSSTTTISPPRQQQPAPQQPPLEDALSRATLFPEVEKLYGHGYEVSCAACSPDGAVIASACRASAAAHAVVRLFETATWTELRPPLAAHSLTVARLRWSDGGGGGNGGPLLLSVGRDRQWAVFGRERAPGGRGGEQAADEGLHTQTYELVQAHAGAHSRMILDAAWAPSGATSPPRAFATAGRDRQVKIWARGEQGAGEFVLRTPLKLDQAVTAVDFAGLPKSAETPFALAVGTENGGLLVYRLDRATLAVASSILVDQRHCPAKAILQLAWRPCRDKDKNARHDELAVAGEDGSLRILAFRDL